MTSVLNIVDVSHLASVNSRIFQLSLKAHVDMLNRDFPVSACATLGGVPSMLAEFKVDDTPQIRAWMWAVQCWSSVFAGKIESPPIESFSHLYLDSMNIARIADLLRFQSLGILLGGNKNNADGIKFAFSTSPPSYLAIPNIGRISFLGRLSRFSIERENKEIFIKTKRKRYSFDAKSNSMSIDGFLFQRSLSIKVMGHLCEIPVYDVSLCQPHFQNFPQIVSGDGVKQWGNDIKKASQWLDVCNIPNTHLVIRWCRAMLGLLSPNQSIGSGSRKEALGLVFLPSAAPIYDMAECLLHESLHQHLFRLEIAVPLFKKENDSSERYYSPWRQDPRPLIMVLHGAFVFAGIAEMHRQAVKVYGAEVNEEIHEKNCYLRASESIQATRILDKYAKMTSVGKTVMECVHKSADLSRECSNLPNRVKLQIDRDLQKRAKEYASYLQ